MQLSLVIGIFLLLTSLIGFLIVLTAKKLDLGERIFRRPRIATRFVPQKDKKSKQQKKEPLPSISKEKANKADEGEYSGIAFDRSVSEKSDDEQMQPPKSKQERTKTEPIYEEKGENVYTRDIEIRIPYNLCLNEVFLLKVTLKTDSLSNEDTILEYIKIDEKEAKKFALNDKKLGTHITSATTAINGIKEGIILVRPIAIGDFATINPKERYMFFKAQEEEIEVEFFITPVQWRQKLIRVIRVEFEQEYRTIKTVDVPVKVFKNKYEAIFGLNLSGFQKYVLLSYSILGSLMGLYSTLSNYLVFLPQLGF